MMTDRMDTEALRAHIAELRRYDFTETAEAIESLMDRVQDLGTEGHAYREGKLAGAKIARDAALEEAALTAEAEAERILSKQDGRAPEVDQNLRFMTLILPGVAEAIRAKKEGGEG